MPDLYDSYTELAMFETEGVDYERRTVPVQGAEWASIAIHGGGIEAGSGEVARSVGLGLMDHYEFAGIKPINNGDLHVTSTNFDEPIAEAMVAESRRTLSFHGFAGTAGVPVTALGGLDGPRIEAIRIWLKSSGFTVISAPQEISGTSPDNIANENQISAGVQIEMSRAQREAFFPGGDLSRAMRDSGQRTPEFYLYVDAIRKAMLGYLPFPLSDDASCCGADYAARIVDLSGSVISEASVIVDVEWTRVLNDTSSASVTISPDGDCCQQMGNVRTWRHQLHIYRNGRYVWGGPILKVEWTADQVEVFAMDISAWLSRRVPHDDYTFTNTDLSVIAQTLIDDGFDPQDPGHSVEILGPARVTGGREYTEGVGQTLDHLQDLSDAGIDWTVSGNKFIVFPEDWSETIGTVLDADLPDGLKVTEDGSTLATRWVVAGGQDGQFVGSSGGADDYYGLLERYVEQTSIPSVDAATAAAAARVRATSQVPVYIDTSEVTLGATAAVDVRTLTPGWCVDIASVATCREITQRLKVIGVKVSSQGSASDGVEKVSLQVAPVGASV